MLLGKEKEKGLARFIYFRYFRVQTCFWIFFSRPVLFFCCISFWLACPYVFQWFSFVFLAYSMVFHHSRCLSIVCPSLPLFFHQFSSSLIIFRVFSNCFPSLPLFFMIFSMVFLHVPLFFPWFFHPFSCIFHIFPWSFFGFPSFSSVFD